MASDEPGPETTTLYHTGEVIQPFGIVFVLDERMKIVQVSENILSKLRFKSWCDIVGRDFIKSMIPPEARADFQQHLDFMYKSHTFQPAARALSIFQTSFICGDGSLADVDVEAHWVYPYSPDEPRLWSPPSVNPALSSLQIPNRTEDDAMFLVLCCDMREGNVIGDSLNPVTSYPEEVLIDCGNESLHFPTIASRFYENAQDANLFTHRFHSICQHFKTLNDCFFWVASFLLGITCYDSIAVYELGDNQIDLKFKLDALQLPGEKYERPPDAHFQVNANSAIFCKRFDQVRANYEVIRYRLPLWLVTQRWDAQVNAALRIRMVYNYLEPSVPICALPESPTVPIHFTLARPLADFQSNYLTTCGAKSVMSIKIPCFGNYRYIFLIYTNEPTRLSFSAVGFLDRLVFDLTQVVESIILQEELKQQQLIDKILNFQLGFEDGAVVNFSPDESVGLVASDIPKVNSQESFDAMNDEEHEDDDCMRLLVATGREFLPLLEADAVIVYLHSRSSIFVKKPAHRPECINILADLTRFLDTSLSEQLVAECCWKDLLGHVQDDTRESWLQSHSELLQRYPGIFFIPLIPDGSSFLCFLKEDVDAFRIKVSDNDESISSMHDTTKILALDNSRAWKPHANMTGKMLQLVLEWLVRAFKERNVRMRNDKFNNILLGNIGHEVRTPLNAVINALEIILEDPETEEAPSLLQDALDAARFTFTLLEDLTTFVQVEPGTLLVKCEEFSLVDCFEKSVKLFCVAAKKRGLDFSFFLDPALSGLIVKGDCSKVRQVLLNLCGNAFKFTDKGCVSVRVECTQKDIDNIQILITVQDTGIGIPPDKLSMIFQEFERLESFQSNRKQIEGAGLGLSITKKILSLLGGDIVVSSEVGMGSTFQVHLPFALHNHTP